MWNFKGSQITKTIIKRAKDFLISKLITNLQKSRQNGTDIKKNIQTNG